MGGDEFMLILPDLNGPEGAIAVAEKIVASLVEPFFVGGRELVVTSSAGIAMFPGDGQDSAILQRVADERMYATKQRGRNGFTIS
jgi:diguanylate cyclase (GGDEF)-like protein